MNCSYLKLRIVSNLCICVEKFKWYPSSINYILNIFISLISFFYFLLVNLLFSFHNFRIVSFHFISIDWLIDWLIGYLYFFHFIWIVSSLLKVFHLLSYCENLSNCGFEYSFNYDFYCLISFFYDFKL